MPSELHFLNVLHGDCTWIKHADGKNSIIDVFNASSEEQGDDDIEKAATDNLFEAEFKAKGVKGNFGQKSYPVNPIKYLKDFSVNSVFRYIQTHPDMDHMGGIKDFFSEYSPINFWDTDNEKEMGSFNGSPYSEEDWKFYKKLRQGSTSDPIRLTLFAGSTGKYYNRKEDGSSGANGLYLVAPTQKLIDSANESDDYNDCSYVIVFRATNGYKIVIAGDSHDGTWDYILKHHKSDVENADLLLAPHHGRDSGRNYDFLDTVNPKLTFFGNANSDHLAYAQWNNRGLEKFTNNQGNCLLARFNSTGIKIFCTYKKFAEAYCKENGYQTYYDSDIKGHYLKTL